MDDREQQKTAAVATALDAMWTRFLPEMRARVSVLAGAARALADGTLNGGQLAAAQAAAHKLAGTLGTFGLERGTELARELEGLYSQPYGSLGKADAARLAAGADAIAALVAARKTG